MVLWILILWLCFWGLMVGDVHHASFIFSWLTYFMVCGAGRWCSCLFANRHVFSKTLLFALGFFNSYHNVAQSKVSSEKIGGWFKNKLSWNKLSNRPCTRLLFRVGIDFQTSIFLWFNRMYYPADSLYWVFFFLFVFFWHLKPVA
jgi:hypothetical protein